MPSSGSFTNDKIDDSQSVSQSGSSGWKDMKIPGTTEIGLRKTSLLVWLCQYSLREQQLSPVCSYTRADNALLHQAKIKNSIFFIELPTSNWQGRTKMKAKNGIPHMHIYTWDMFNLFTYDYIRDKKPKGHIDFVIIIFSTVFFSKICIPCFVSFYIISKSRNVCASYQQLSRLCNLHTNWPTKVSHSRTATKN